MTFSNSVKAALVAVALSAGMAGVANANDKVFTATLAEPLSSASRPIAGSMVWRCSETTCTTVTPRSLGAAVCRQLGRQVGGYITAFGTPEESLSAEELARCNAGREAPATAQ